MAGKPIVKICGLMDAATVRETARLPVDYMGFIFAESRRKVEPEHAASWIAEINASGQRKVRTVGVFLDPFEERIREVLEKVPLDAVQLHGKETAEFCRRIKQRYGVELIKAVSLPGSEATEGDTSILNLESYRDVIDVLLLDTLDPVTGGGSGRTFAWDRLPPYQAWAGDAGIPLLAAGGLNPDNVGELLERFGPDGVDVSSGVETNGRKDIQKIRTFVERVKAIGSSS